MFRRVFQSVTGIAKSLQQGRGATPNIAIPNTFPKNYDASDFQGNDHRAAAFEDLKTAVKELAVGSSSTITFSDNKLLLQWNETELSELSIEQLQELARAFYVGISGSHYKIDQDYCRAIQIWDEAAMRGCLESQYSLAICYRDGKGVDIDPERAFEMMTAVAEKNFPLANYELGIMMTKGFGTPPDDNRAFLNFKAAAKGGVGLALHNIANCYAMGKGVKQSDHNALLYYEAAAFEFGDPSAKFTLANWYYQGRQLKQDKHKAFKLQLEAAQSGHPGAVFNVGAQYMSGEVVERDLIKAAIWFEKAADFGMVQGAVNLGNMYYRGHGFPKDVRKAREIFHKFSSKDEFCKSLVEAIDLESDVEETTK